MIETFRTANGEPAFAYDGRLLCSKVAPVKEAEAFVAKFAVQIERSRTVFLLGLGGGHVVDAIHKSYPDKKIVVIEAEGTIVETVSCCFTFALMRVEILKTAELDDVKIHRSVLAGLNSSYCVLSQPCNQWLNPEFYESVKNLLLGRAPSAFAFMLTAREDVRDALRPLVQVSGLASIKTLNQNLAANTVTPVDREKSKIKLFIKILRELVV